MRKKTSKQEVEIENGNVFEQLRLPEPEERLRKARLMNVINAAIKRSGFSQKEAADVTGLDQSDISRIQHGRYSTDRLLNVLVRLGIGIELVQRHGTRGDVVIEVRELARVR